MTVLDRAVEIAALLDPSLMAELEQEVGSDWQVQLEESVVAKVGKFEIGRTEVRNDRQQWNPIRIGRRIAGNIESEEGKVGEDGVYEVTSVVNYEDRNTQRATHRHRYTVNGEPVGQPIEPTNYIRASSNHFTGAGILPDLLELKAGDVVGIESQSASVTTGTSDVTGGWLILKKN